MTDEAFWQLIARAAEQPGDRDERAEWLTEELTRLPVAQIVDFAVRLHTVRTRADTPGLLRAARLIHDGVCTDEVFRSFQLWLLTLGRAAFDAVVADADALADQAPVRELAARPMREWSAQDWPEWESLDFAAHDAYGESGERALDEELSELGVAHSAPAAPLSRETVVLPRLTALFDG
ncbi:DUF4240 domain-containing protein [Actinokineospora pegani]|uniref:DUF4240 domain-containing protein n=1 Tax=Actinokineospora pegani TaxID=2654637 RepID=UPI0018D332B3|nr:DUF4240 domain-containing protein [Actinokineospora pegani]